MIINLSGSSRALSDPRVLWAIQKKLMSSPSGVVAFQVGNIKGEVLHKAGKSSEVIKLIKAAASPRGELDVHEEVLNIMRETHLERLERLTDELEALLSDDLEKGSHSYPREWFKPPVIVAQRAQEGLDLRAEYGRGGLSHRQAAAAGVGSGVQRALDLSARENVSPKTIKRMISFFARHRQNKDNTTKSGEPSAGRIAWLLWGGDEGEKWALKVREKMRAQDESKGGA